MYIKASDTEVSNFGIIIITITVDCNYALECSSVKIYLVNTVVLVTYIINILCGNFNGYS